jgi:hypothetical protein
MVAELEPFKVQRQHKGMAMKPQNAHKSKDNVRFKVPGAEFTSFYGGKDPFLNFKRFKFCYHLFQIFKFERFHEFFYILFRNLHLAKRIFFGEESFKFIFKD